MLVFELVVGGGGGGDIMVPSLVCSFLVFRVHGFGHKEAKTKHTSNRALCFCVNICLVHIGPSLGRSVVAANPCALGVSRQGSSSGLVLIIIVVF